MDRYLRDPVFKHKDKFAFLERNRAIFYNKSKTKTGFEPRCDLKGTAVLWVRLRNVTGKFRKDESLWLWRTAVRSVGRRCWPTVNWPHSFESSRREKKRQCVSDLRFGCCCSVLVHCVVKVGRRHAYRLADLCVTVVNNYCWHLVQSIAYLQI